ncbi:RDD family protein [Xanthocytophaga agilis]|uniref:RDD family protein n=1 Tax=Xanthocytophaga agilis TaxID=3048010 RepID=A0AAE3R1A3_9BACT|nr:RDD family protein [Xanthocytophaga agilis]MDJ1501816.1 RDD family protein [Xanthocytophaga agilis]
MKKITELEEVRWRTVYFKDEYGNRYRDTEEYIGYRTVTTITAGLRITHFIIDIIAYNILCYFLAFVFELIMALTDDMIPINLTVGFISLIITLLLYPTYYTFFEYYWQQTPGKFLTQAIVIDEYGNRPTIRQILLRSFIRLVPFETLSCSGTNSYGWHDRWAETYVVSKKELVEIKQFIAQQEGNTVPAH